MEQDIFDIHMHVLPNVDDGAPCMDDSLLMIRESIRHGITAIFATSHNFAFINAKESAYSHSMFQQLQAKLMDEKLPIQLYLGCEILCTYRWMTRIIRALEEGLYPSMNQTKYILIEFPSWDTSKEEACYCASSLLNEGWIPVFAHIERYSPLFADVEFVRSMRKMGCLFQINLYSLVEEISNEIRLFCRELIQLELVDFVGTDAHNMHHRPPKYEPGIAYLKEHCSEAYLSLLLNGNAKRYFF